MLTLLRSLLFSTLLSFVAPVLLVGSILAALFATSHVPGFTWVSRTGFSQILQFLTIFGGGYPLQGLLTLDGTMAIDGS